LHEPEKRRAKHAALFLLARDFRRVFVHLHEPWMNGGKLRHEDEPQMNGEMNRECQLAPIKWAFLAIVLFSASL
jgi:hypothetical protein